MNFSLRSLGLALLLLLLFLGATLVLQWWLAKETRQLRNLAVEEQRAHLLRALSVGGSKPEQWDAAFQEELGAMLGGTVRLIKSDGLPAPEARDLLTLSFVQDLPTAPGWRAQVQFATPALLRVQVLHQRTLTVIVVLSLLVAMMPLLLVLISSRRPTLADGASRAPWRTSKAQAVGFEHFAKISHEKTEALALEQDARLRAEENLEVNRSMLDHSLASRVKLGRELHDNISQTLYAVCLTLESVQKKNTLAPELKQRVDQCMTELRRLNQEVRAFLQDLEPARVQSQSFTSAVSGMLAAFADGDGVKLDQRLDEEAVALVPPGQIADIMNVLREAVSNSLRHGHARNVSVLAARSDQEIALAVQDDGDGFVPGGSGGGHGLTNMQARAKALGGSLRIESTPGKGTRVLLSLPVASA